MTSFSVKPSEGVVHMSGKGKLLNALPSEKRLIAASAKPCCNAGSKQLQRRSKHAESLVKHWDGVKGNSVSKGFDRSSFWSDVNLCKGFSTSRIVSKNLAEVATVTAGSGEFVEDSVPSVDQASGGRLDRSEAASLEIASFEVEGNGESCLSADRETDAAAAEMDGNA